MSLKLYLKAILSKAIKDLWNEETDIIPLEYPEFKQYGDYATPVAMILARKLKKNPKEIANSLVEYLKNYPELNKIEIAGPGYINFFISDSFLNQEIKKIIEDENYGKNNSLDGKKILLEYVSANPTGPLHVGHGRWAAIGDSLSRLLKFCGADVTREFYINDAGIQVKLFYESVEAVKSGRPIPENGYHGEYIKEIASMEGDPLLNMIAEQQSTLSKFRVQFDNYFSEKNLHISGAVQRVLEYLKKSGHGYESEGAFWFKSTDFGDDKDRVLVKSDGDYTYFAVDIAYHRDKIRRGFDQLINVLGADHHGYTGRLKAAVRVMAEEAAREVELVILIGQLVSLFRNGEPVRMSKRTGEMITLEELIDEIGVDAARYYLVMRKADTPLEFDIEEAKKQSEDNPVFYVQYAHARICSILRNAGVTAISVPEEIIDSPEAREIAIELVKFEEVLVDAARAFEPHRIPLYLENLASVLHRFYNKHRVISEDKEKTLKRLSLVMATGRIIKKGLDLIGVSAPEKM